MAITATPVAENDRPLNANSVGFALNNFDTAITATGGNSGTFLPGETIVQAVSGARGTFLFAISGSNQLFVSQIGSTAFTTTAGHTLTGLRSGATRANPSAVAAPTAVTSPNLPSGLTVEEFGFGPIRLTPVWGRSSTNSFATQPIYAFPQGYIQTLGGFGRLTVTGGAQTAATAALLYSVGTSPVVSGTAGGGANSAISNIFNQVSQTMAAGTVTFNLLSGVVSALAFAQGSATDTIPAINTPTAAEVQNAVQSLATKINAIRGNMVAGALIDGTTTPALAYLNATASGTTAFTAESNNSILYTGTLNLLWANLGNLNNNA
jgi:hypothetical protein